MVSKSRAHKGIATSASRALRDSRIGAKTKSPSEVTVNAPSAEARAEMKVPKVTVGQRAAAARIRVTVDRKNGRKTAQWIVDLANQH